MWTTWRAWRLTKEAGESLGVDEKLMFHCENGKLAAAKQSCANSSQDTRKWTTALDDGLNGLCCSRSGIICLASLDVSLPPPSCEHSQPAHLTSSTSAPGLRRNSSLKLDFQLLLNERWGTALSFFNKWNRLFWRFKWAESYEVDSSCATECMMDCAIPLRSVLLWNKRVKVWNPLLLPANHTVV